MNNIFLQVQVSEIIPGKLLEWMLLLIPLLPLAAFVILGLFGRKYFNRSAGIIATLLLTVSTLLALYSAYSYFFEYGKVDGAYHKVEVFKYTWLQFSKNLSIDMGAMIDPITALMLVVVTFISLMVHIYSLAYLKDKKGSPLIMRSWVYLLFLCLAWYYPPIFSSYIFFGNW